MTPADAIDVGEQLIQLLTQQRLLYKQLQELAQKQSSLVDGSDPEMLLRVLAGRQRLIDRLKIIDTQLGPIRDSWKQISLSLPTQQRQLAEQLISEVQSILADIIKRDAKDVDVLQKQQQCVAGKIRSAAAGKRMNNAYANNNANSNQSRFLDTHSG